MRNFSNYRVWKPVLAPKRAKAVIYVRPYQNQVRLPKKRMAKWESFQILLGDAKNGNFEVILRKCMPAENNSIQTRSCGVYTSLALVDTLKAQCFDKDIANNLAGFSVDACEIDADYIVFRFTDAKALTRM